MAKKFKKLLSLALSALMVLNLVGMTALASETEPITGTITEDTVWNDGDVIGGVKISGGTAAKPITITVNGTVTVDGQITLDSTDMCYVKFVGGDDNATLIRGANNAGGAVIWAQGTNRNYHTLTIDGIVLDGGAVWSGEEHATLGRGTTNEGVVATGSNASILFVRYTDVFMKDSAIQNQDSRTDKGCAVNLGYGKLVLEDSVVSNNYHVNNRAGAIHMRNGATVIATGTEFYGNHGAQGGVIGTSTSSAYASVMEFTDCSFTNNYSTGAGAVFHLQDNQYYGHLKVVNCTIKNNDCATRDRGIVDSSSYTVPAYFENCTITENGCNLFGYFSNENKNIFVSGSTVTTDYEGYLSEAPLKIYGAVASMPLNAATVNHLMTKYGYIATEEGYSITDADAKAMLGENAEYTIADTNGDGKLDLIAATFENVSVTVYDNFPGGEETSEVQSVPAGKYPTCNFAHEGYVFNGWYDADGVAATGATEGAVLYAQWKVETPEVTIVSDKDTVIGYEEYTLSISEFANYSDAVTYTYQWYLDESVIEGATEATLTTQGVDLGAHHYTCKVVASQDGFVTSDTEVTNTVRVIVLPVARIIETGAQFRSLADAVNAANELTIESVTVELLVDIDFDSTAALTVNRDMTIIGEHTVSRGDYTGTLFTVSAGAALTLDGGIVFDGSNNWTFNKELYDYNLNNLVTGTVCADYAVSAEGGTVSTATVFVVNGTMTVKDATIQNFFNTKDSNAGDGAIFKVTNADATLVMDGAVVNHVATYGANAVVALKYGEWYIKGDTVISNNFGGRNGGMCRNDYGQIYMTGGTILNNAGRNVNGTFIMVYGGGSEFNMTGGTICGNSSVGGTENGRCATLYLHSGGVINITGGSVCHNMGGNRGGIDAYTASALNINRADQVFVDGVYANENGADAYNAANHPYIIDNVSISGNSRHDVGNNGSVETCIWWVTGGIYTQDVDEFCAAGYICIPYEDSERTDDYIVVPGYRVKYYSVTTEEVIDPETSEPTIETVTTLEEKRYVLLPRDKFWHEAQVYADYIVVEDEENGMMIDSWYTEEGLINLYDFENTVLTADINVYGSWVEIPETVDVTVSVEWDHGTNAVENRPTSVQVQLYANDVAYGDPITVTADTDWTNVWEDLLKCDEDGSEIVYTVRQVDVLDDYETNVTGVAYEYAITNTYIEPEETEPEETEPEETEPEETDPEETEPEETEPEETEPEETEPEETEPEETDPEETEPEETEPEETEPEETEPEETEPEETEPEETEPEETEPEETEPEETEPETETETEEDVLIEIPDEEVPRDDVPKTGDRSFTWTLMFAISCTGLVVTSVFARKKREEE